MHHAKFDSPSINIDIYFQLSDSRSYTLSYSGTQWQDQDLELCTLPEARGTANNVSQQKD